MNFRISTSEFWWSLKRFFRRFKRSFSEREQCYYDFEYGTESMNKSEEDFDVAIYDLQGRFPEGEDDIKGLEYVWYGYLDFLKWKLYSEKTKREWIQEGVNENLFEILNYLGMSAKTQELLIQARPDLVNQIPKLHPALKTKYQHEVELGNVDL
jgi:hypothetical protein